MNTGTSAVGLALLVTVAVVAGSGLVGAQQQSTVEVGSPSVSAGSQATADVTVDELPDGLQTYEVTVSLADPRVANVTGAAPGDVRGDGFSVVSQSSDSITLRGADFDDRVQPGDSDVLLGTVYFNDTFGGTSDLDVTVNTLRSDNRTQVNATTSAGELQVTGGTPRPTATATATATATPTPTPTATATDTATPDGTTTAATTGTDATATGADTPATETATFAQETIPPVTETATPTATATETTASSGPGFTAGLALVALVAAALLVVRRRY